MNKSKPSYQLLENHYLPAPVVLALGAVEVEAPVAPTPAAVVAAVVDGAARFLGAAVPCWRMTSTARVRRQRLLAKITSNCVHVEETKPTHTFSADVPP